MTPEAIPSSPSSPAANGPPANSLFDLTGKTAIVTGTSRGLGQGFARALAKAGADLVLSSRTRPSLAAFELEIQALRLRALSLELDVRYQHSIHQMAGHA